MRVTVPTPFAIAILTILAVTTSEAQQPTLDGATALAVDGHHAAAEDLYDSLLLTEPQNSTVLVGRGYVRAWQGHHQAALDDFESVLSIEPTHMGALVGMAFTFAWSAQYDEAEHAFLRAAAVDSTSIDVEKGLAYVALWRGDADMAIQRFDTLAAAHPGDAELRSGVGWAHLAAGHRRAAYHAFQKSRHLDANREDARLGLEAARAAPPTVEIGATFGYTRFNGTGADGRAGLRAAQITVTPLTKLRLWARVDNGLSLDNPGLATLGQDIPTYAAGGLMSWGRFTTKVEVGARKLGTVTQQLYTLEQVVFAPGGIVLKTGGWIGPRSDGRVEWVLGGGAGKLIGRRLYLESTVYTSENGLPNADGYRLAVSGNYRLATGLLMSAGGSFGQTGIGLTETTTLGEGYVTLSIPVRTYQRLEATVRHQVLGTGATMTVTALGVTVGLGR